MFLNFKIIITLVTSGSTGYIESYKQKRILNVNSVLLGDFPGKTTELIKMP